MTTPLLYGTNGSLDPGTHETLSKTQVSRTKGVGCRRACLAAQLAGQVLKIRGRKHDSFREFRNLKPTQGNIGNIDFAFFFMQLALFESLKLEVY